MTRRRIEIVAAATAIGAAAALAAFVLVWRVFYDDAPWSLTLPPPIDFSSRWSGFTIYAWAELALLSLVIVAGVSAAVLAMLGKRATAANVILGALVFAALAGACAIYSPLSVFTTFRTDRLRGRVEEPVHGFRAFVVTIVVVAVAHILLILATTGRHTPAFTRALALSAAAVSCAITLHFFWLIAIFPATNTWFPGDWDRADLLIPVRPCRGAALWSTDLHLIGFVDDLWLSFRDPRAGGRRVRAISFSGDFRGGYFWMTLAEAAELRVRADDPKVIRCEARWRRDEVAPAGWHTLGWHAP